MSPNPDPATDMRSQLLTGLTVIELPHSVAIRYCGRLLAAMGAKVLQVGAASTDGVGYGAAASTAYGAWLDAGKTLVSADLARAMAETGSVDLVLAGPRAAAVAEADLAIQTAGDAAGRSALRLGLTWFASDGPYRDWTGSDAVIQAMSGVAYSTGAIDGDPMLPRGHAPQAVAGTVACIAALGALIGRRRGWTGRQIDVDVLSANLCFHESTACSAAADNEPVRRRGVNRFTPTYPAGIYKTLDGWTGLTALTPPQWVALCGLVGQPGLGLDLRHHVTLNRLDDADQLDAVLRPALAQRSSAHWLTEGQALRIPFAPVPTLAELPLTPHWRERASFAPIAGLAQALGPTLPFKVELITASAGSQPAARSATAAGSQPLGGLRVLDLTMGWAGPLATRHLADLGADVVKVESCSHIDWWRGFDAMTDADPPAYETRPSFLMVNRHKRGITLDFKTDTGRGLLRRLAAGSDLMIENYAPGALNKLGLGTRAMANTVPGLIAVSMGAFGNQGPWSAFRAYGSTVEQASGFPFVNGQASDPPTMQHVAYGDPVAGLYGALACLAAIYRRESAVDDKACLVDLGQVECLFQLAADAIVAQSTQSDALARDGNRHPMSALRITAGCAAGAAGPAWIAVSVETPAQWQALAGLLGFAGAGAHEGQSLSSKCGFATLLDPHGGRPALAGLGALKTHEADLEAAVRAWAATRQARDAVASLQRAGVPAGPVQPGNTLPEDPQFAAMGYFRTMQRRHVGQHLSTQTPYRFDGAALPIGGPAPTLGQHNAELLCDRLGLSAGEYDELLKSGVIGTRATANG